MDEQLTLIQAPTSWKLDEQTRRTGLRGVAEAKAALQAHRARDDHRDRHRSAA